MKRIDKALVEDLGVVSRSQAKDLILRGKVIYNGQVVNKVSFQVLDSSQLEITTSENFVGRGALKIRSAVEYFKVELKAKTLVDIGASTGGFTDYFLQSGGHKSYCVDVGHDQLAKHLAEDKRVEQWEGVNVKYPFSLPEEVDLLF